MESSADASCLDEDTALGFLSRELPEPRARTVIAHAAECGSCRRLLATLASAVHANDDASQRETVPDARATIGPLLLELQQGDCVDRYVIRRRVGIGAMGVVYAAFDPQLDREVALKILDRSAPGLDEARAMAQVAHPNIVTVFDAGTFEGRGFVAMELVRGTTLAHWLRSEAHDWRTILDRFREAAAGLAAVHAAGLIHGDFKPDNVLVGEDGRARVADFGLAQPSGTNDAAGTPAYMAPERRLGEKADARADQFSFCVALFESLCGQRPFTAEGAPVPPPSTVPRRLRRAIARGLAPDPAARFPSMIALAYELGHVGRPRRILAIAAVAAIAVTGGAVAFGLRAGASDTDRDAARDAAAAACARDATAITAEWNPRVRGELEAAFGAVARPSDHDTFGAVARLLDARAAEWSRQRRTTCEAHARGDESAALFELRRACLDAQRVGMATLLELFATPDAQIVERALESARAAIALGPCASASPPQTPPPRDAEGVEIRRALARARALQLLGKLDDAHRLAESLVPRAAHDPRLTAQVMSQLGSLLDDLGQATLAEDRLLQGISAAERGGDDSMKATLLVRLVWVVGISNARFDEGERLGRLATAALERADDPHLRATLEYTLGNIDDARGHHAEALGRYEQALLLHEQQYGAGAAETAPTLNALGITAGQLHRYDESLAYLRRARTALESLYGPRHPMIALTLINIAQVLAAQGDLDGAIATDREALAIQESVFGPDHEKTAMVVAGLADVMKLAKRWDEALVLYRRAATSFERTLGDTHPMLAIPWFGIGVTEHALGRAAEARSWLGRALTLCDRSGLPPAQCADIRFALASATWDSGGDRRAARELAEAARDANPTAAAEIDAWLAKRR